MLKLNEKGRYLVELIFLGVNAMDYTYTVETDLGKVFLASDGESLTGLWLEGQKHFGSTFSEKTVSATLAVFIETEKWLTQYFSGKEPTNKIPLAPEGTDFQKRVWQQLIVIPYGETISYKEIADQLNILDPSKKTSPRAVGSAVAHNPISILIPCHRVLGSDGSLTGYAGGIDKKKRLLFLEKTNVTE